MDMSPSFKSAVEEALDQPLTIADTSFLPIYFLMERRRVQANWHDYDRKKCKRMRYVFYKNSDDLNETDRWYLKRYCQMSKEIKNSLLAKRRVLSLVRTGKEKWD